MRWYTFLTFSLLLINETFSLGNPYSKDMIDVLTKRINGYRKTHQVDGLKWDEGMRVIAQGYAETLAKDGYLHHSGNGYGENLYSVKKYPPIDIFNATVNAIDSWYSEVSRYNYLSPNWDAGVGHFTCLVWKSSNEYALGVATKQEPFPGSKSLLLTSHYVVFSSKPTCNIWGLFVQNVLSPIINYPKPSPKLSPKMCMVCSCPSKSPPPK
jgi:hypothetical protein